jgi:hypothetical protein
VLQLLLRCYENRETGCKKWLVDGGDRVYWWGFWEGVGVLWDLIPIYQVVEMYN